MSIQSEINLFWNTAEQGKSCALDANINTGELLFRATKSTTGQIGDGTPPIPMTENWTRVMICINGVVSRQ